MVALVIESVAGSSNSATMVSQSFPAISLLTVRPCPLRALNLLLPRTVQGGALFPFAPLQMW